jgi:hypothetical protein
VLYLVAGAPVKAGAVADTVMGTAATAINTAINGPGGTSTPGGTSGSGGSGGPGAAGADVADPGTDAVAPFVDHVLYTHWLAGQLGSSTSPTAVRYGPVLFRAKAVSFAEAAAVKGDADATRTLFETKQRSWAETADKIKDEDPDAYAYLTGERTNRTGEALPALAGTYTLAFPVFAFALMMAGYLVIRFVVMTAPVWATVAIIEEPLASRTAVL